MKSNRFPVLLCTAFFLMSCSAHVPIADLRLPPVNIISGTVTAIENDGFVLRDKSGSIKVNTGKMRGGDIGLSTNQAVEVVGNMDTGKERQFLAYIIKKSDGSEVRIQSPTPHIGFVIQSSFD